VCNQRRVQENHYFNPGPMGVSVSDVLSKKSGGGKILGIGGGSRGKKSRDRTTTAFIKNVST
jgi:hypothetical protein